MHPPPPSSTLFPYTTLFRSAPFEPSRVARLSPAQPPHTSLSVHRSEEHTSELQSRPHLVCRLLLEKKKSIQRRGPCPTSYTAMGCLPYMLSKLLITTRVQSS